MAKLILSLDGSMIREVPLDKERIMIGRKASNDIQIENLAVSGEHACIVTILNDSFLEDLGSTNGTLVNGNPIKKHILQNSDVIEIGKYKLKYVADAPAAGQAASEDFEKTMILRPSAKPAAAPAAPPPAAAPAKPAAPAAPAAAPAPAAAAKPATPPPTPKPAPPAAPASAKHPAPAVVPAKPATLTPKPAPVAAPAAKTGEGQPVAAVQILTGPSAGKELELTKNLTTLGKPGLQVSVITKRPQGYFIAHVEGAKFPVVNGDTIDAQARPLKDHDVIEIAGVKMEFFFKK